MTINDALTIAFDLSGSLMGSKSLADWPVGQQKGSKMRYRVYFKESQTVELTAYDLRVVGSKAVELNSNGGMTIDAVFTEPMERIADNHDRTVYQR